MCVRTTLWLALAKPRKYPKPSFRPQRLRGGEEEEGDIQTDEGEGGLKKREGLTVCVYGEGVRGMNQGRGNRVRVAHKDKDGGNVLRSSSVIHKLHKFETRYVDIVYRRVHFLHAHISGLITFDGHSIRTIVLLRDASKTAEIRKPRHKPDPPTISQRPIQETRHVLGVWRIIHSYYCDYNFNFAYVPVLYY